MRSGVGAVRLQPRASLLRAAERVERQLIADGRPLPAAGVAAWLSELASTIAEDGDVLLIPFDRVTPPPVVADPVEVGSPEPLGASRAPADTGGEASPAYIGVAVDDEGAPHALIALDPTLHPVAGDWHEIDGDLLEPQTKPSPLPQMVSRAPAQMRRSVESKELLPVERSDLIRASETESYVRATGSNDAWAHSAVMVLKTLGANNPKFRLREAQVAMAEIVGEQVGKACPRPSPKADRMSAPANLGTAPVAIIEAGTGTGKSFGYIAGALPPSLVRNLHVVISTATIALQDQLVSRDLPTLAKLIDAPFQFTAAKGRANYVCNLKLDQLLKQDRPGQEIETALLSQMRDKLKDGTWDGDRGALRAAGDGQVTQVDDQTWSALTMTSSRCKGQSCSHYRECAFQSQLSARKSAQVIVANHALVLADLATGGGRLLPDPAKTVYVFDEAHHLPHVARGAMAGSFDPSHAIDALQPIANTVTAHIASLAGGPRRWERANYTISTNVRAARSTLQLVEFELAAAFGKLPRGKESKDAIEDRTMPAGLRSGLVSAKRTLRALHDSLVDLATQTDTPPGAGIRQVARRISGIVRDIERLAAPPSDVPRALWAEGSRDGLILHHEPVAAREDLKRVLVDRAAGLVFASATISALGSMSAFIRDVGLNGHPDIKVGQFKSPFDWQRGTIKVPTMKTTPSEDSDEAVAADIANTLPRTLAKDGGTLVLFSSRAMMSRVYELLPPDIQGRVLTQDQGPKPNLLGKHGLGTRLGGSPVLFGLDSFSEGLDLPGALCSSVVLTRLPFKPPTGHVEQIAYKAVKDAGGNPFEEISLPEVCIKLIQAAGRLLRTEADWGTLWILDNRVRTKPYGRKLLAALPPYNVEFDGVLQEVRAGSAAGIGQQATEDAPPLQAPRPVASASPRLPIPRLRTPSN